MNYQRVYDQIMRLAKIRCPLSRCYYERHHIKPKCLGGRDTERNMVYLTPEEHYIAHQLLVKLYPDNRKLLWAALSMSMGPKGRACNKRYGWLKRRWSVSQTINNTAKSPAARRKISEHARTRIGAKNPMFGRNHSPETCKLFSEIFIGKGKGVPKPPFSEEHCANISKAKRLAYEQGAVANFKGCRHSDEVKEICRSAAIALGERRRATAQELGVPSLTSDDTRRLLANRASDYWAKRRELGLPGFKQQHLPKYKAALAKFNAWLKERKQV